MTQINNHKTKHKKSANAKPFWQSARHLWSKLFLIIASICILFLIAGYAYFSAKIPNYNTHALSKKTDGIVVLTGGENRLKTAFTLLDAKVAKRLLISGVHENTSKHTIFKTLGYSNPSSTCCVDIDKVALNTKGNAAEAAKWAKTLNFKSLTIVTSDYHMMRSLFEFRQALPNVELVAHPVNAKKVLPSGQYLRTKLREYGKLITALVSTQLSNYSKTTSFASVF
ncbi:MAG: YdcF family protein [Nitratireductor sp.]